MVCKNVRKYKRPRRRFPGQSTTAYCVSFGLKYLHSQLKIDNTESGNFCCHVLSSLYELKTISTWFRLARGPQSCWAWVFPNLWAFKITSQPIKEWQHNKRMTTPRASTSIVSSLFFTNWKQLALCLGLPPGPKVVPFPNWKTISTWSGLAFWTQSC